MKFLIVLLGLSAACASQVEPELVKKLMNGPASVMINFGSTEQVLAEINNQVFVSSGARAQAVYDALNAHAAQSQKSVQKQLKKDGVKFQSFWISNEIHIQEATLAVVSRIADFPEIATINEEKIGSIEFENHNIVEHGRDTIYAEWGVEHSHGEAACNAGACGAGVRVCVIDTGIRGTHEALRGKNHAGHHWYDPQLRTATPGDTNGHGTHCTGTILGEGGIGMAPRAHWQGCVGCPNGSCPQAALTGCAQFAVCPHAPDGSGADCNQHAHLCSNSWGGGQGQTWYNPSISAWRAAGITPVFAQGNSGATCGSANSPGDNAEVIGVGSLAQSGNNIIMSSFSSRGPTTAGSGSRIKPDIAAPGSVVRSSWHTSDTAYNSISGTSMACPHVAGAVALLRSKNMNASYAQIYAALTNSADKTRVQPTNQNCGGVSESTFPNNNVGHGMLHAANAHETF